MKILVLLVSFIFIGCGGSNTDDFSPEELAAKTAAATTTATTNANCTSIFPFYWEIGNGSGLLSSGSTGDLSVGRATEYPIGSATKWVFAAYVAQKLGGTIDATTAKFLKMSSGYTNFSLTSCVGSATVAACQSDGSNGVYSATNNNKFYDNGGHFQKWAVDHAMGALTRPELAVEFKNTLGQSFDHTWSSTQMAGGIRTSAQNYSVFLQRILSGSLKFRSLLGVDPICTYPITCATAVSSPINEALHYSYGHWIEDQNVSSDGAFSSPGLYGFYPWIDKDKRFYGILSRYQNPVPGNEMGSGLASLQCGKMIRKAFVTGVAQ